MGGSGDFRGGVTPNEQRIAEKLERAREELARARAIRRNLFISFAYEDLPEVNLLRAHAKNENSEIDFVDRSVRDPYDSERADYIQQRISERIRQSSMTVVYLSPHTLGSAWVNWEVERSVALGRKVVAFYKGDEVPLTVPDVITKHNIKVVSWSALAREIEPEQ